MIRSPGIRCETFENIESDYISFNKDFKLKFSLKNNFNGGNVSITLPFT